MVHFSGTSKEVTAMEYAQIFVDTNFRLHGLPEVIISDRDPRFTGKFWRALLTCSERISDLVLRFIRKQMDKVSR